MAWLIACFIDHSVSMISEKWMKKNGIKCWFPKIKVAFNIKNETPVDKKSGKWGLYAYRILMHGAKYATLKEAKKAEKTAQNHATMTSFEKSYEANQEARKHPKVYDESSASECVTADSEINDQLMNSDRGSLPSKEKKYVYHGDVDANNPKNDQELENGQIGEDDEVYFDGSNDGDIVSENSDDVNGSNDDVNGLDDGVDGSDDGVDESDVDDDMGAAIDEDDDMSAVEHGDDGMGPAEDNDNNVDGSDDEVPENHLGEQSFVPDHGNNFESTSEVQCPAANYDFSDARCLQRIEKLVMHACQELELIKREVKSLKIKSTETEEVVGKLVAVCKDLSVEVFTCTAELKKRNGMFADMLVPDVKLTLKRRKDFKKNESTLANTKIVENLIKYLASTINESKENKFIEGCFNAIFDIEFLTNKVWWKSEQGKILIKKSRTLHCMKESFKEKFGLVQPKRCDKTIEALIHKTCRNMKDNYRKSLKKAREAEENCSETTKKKSAKKVVKEAVKEAAKEAAEKAEEEVATKAAEKNEKEATKKAAKEQAEVKLTKIVSTEANIQNERGCINENDWDLEDYENYKKHKKAKKQKKVKLITEESDRVAKHSGRLSVKNSREDFDVGVNSSKNDMKRSGDDFDSNGAYKRKKKN